MVEVHRKMKRINGLGAARTGVACSQHWGFALLTLPQVGRLKHQSTNGPSKSTALKTPYSNTSKPRVAGMRYSRKQSECTSIPFCMHGLTTKGVNVVIKHLLQVNQTTLARAVFPVLQGRKGDGLYFNHGWKVLWLVACFDGFGRLALGGRC